MSERQRELERSNRNFFAVGKMLMMAFALLIGVVGLISVVPPARYEATARITVVREHSGVESVQPGSFQRTEYSPWGGQLVAEGNSIEFISRLVEAAAVHEDESLSSNPDGSTLLETAAYLRRATVVTARPDEGIVEVSVVLENTRPAKVRWWANKVANALVKWGQEMQLAEGLRMREMALQIREGFSDRAKQSLALLEGLGVDVGSLDREVLHAFRAKEDGDAAIELVDVSIKKWLLDLEAIEALGDSPTLEALDRLPRRNELLSVPAAKNFLKVREDILVYCANTSRRASELDSTATIVPEALQQRLITSIHSTKERILSEIALMEDTRVAKEQEQKQLEARYRNLVAAREEIESLDVPDRINLPMLESTAQTLREIGPEGKLLRESIVFSERAEETPPSERQLSARVLNLGLFGIVLAAGALFFVSQYRERKLAKS